MYKFLYRESLTLEQAVAAIDGLRGQDAAADADIDTMLPFLAAAKRGIVR
ncbi:hypothetical protein ACVBEH_25490 [Roseateles sp. GG27B]